MFISKVSLNVIELLKTQKLGVATIDVLMDHRGLHFVSSLKFNIRFFKLHSQTELHSQRKPQPKREPQSYGYVYFGSQ